MGKKNCIWVLGLTFLLAACAADDKSGNAAGPPGGYTGGGELEVRVPSPSDPIPEGFTHVGDYKPTFYWVGMEQRSSSPKTKELIGMDGTTVIARVTESYWRTIRLEGTGRLLDGRVLNFGRWAAEPGGQILWVVVDPYSPYGYGKDFRPLVPFRSIAVDPNKIPLDSEIYIPQARGAVLPDGAIHNGYFKAVDIGQAIQELRIDVFTAFGDQTSVFSANGFRNMVPTPVYVRTSNR